MFLRPRQHSIGYVRDGFYRSKDPTNSIKVLKENLHRKTSSCLYTAWPVQQIGVSHCTTAHNGQGTCGAHGRHTTCVNSLTKPTNISNNSPHHDKTLLEHFYTQIRRNSCALKRLTANECYLAPPVDMIQNNYNNSVTPVTHIQQTYTRNVHENFDASSSQFLAPKQLSGQSRCTVRVMCRTVSALE